ncbi:LexA family transcriptional regulator [Pseudomonas luteola]|uniref:LexA family transcriptional regulator n=1 Tax=Pseudomonas luteola TaxID=47886 RepID=UPI0015E47033|nr:XRE family transcriptional regulator [Pseudomonas zeshuii]MBA1249882.1 LexA family transcriptional regulator [Pseudomonas zeshuii]
MNKKRALPPDRLAECQAAHELFLKKKGPLKLSQKKLAEMAGMSAPAVNLYFKGLNPLNAKFAAILAKALQVDVADFSPRLAQEIGEMSAAMRSNLEDPAGPQETTSAADLVSQMLAKHGKNLSDEARQRIADAVIETAETKLVAGEVITADIANPGLVGDEIHIAHYDVRAAMGGGQIASDYAEILRDVRVSETHLRELGVTYDDPHHLKIVTGWGQSMEPTIKHRDPLIVDANVREFTGDGIYLFSWQGLLYIKRLEIIDAEHFDMISDNPMHKDRPIRRDETYIQARVLLVWNARRV